ncbi:hypothetical protein [Geothrix sp. PMB-07]|uniref:hypothetical protein n=1 Tax=Geothrix sp. PMB-07 TaxID=3068640 RepID=UPI0027424A05|nr:hypothetical protein [Geothrix sp. PMB-07]WLT30066.1 hypothetical protein Q9293_10090 [Geothrix sp. PMB-07]
MPAGTTCPRPPIKVIEKATVRACIAIARKVQEARFQAGDTAGSDAARLVARLMEEELLEQPGDREDLRAQEASCS